MVIFQSNFQSIFSILLSSRIQENKSHCTPTENFPCVLTLTEFELVESYKILALKSDSQFRYNNMFVLNVTSLIKQANHFGFLLVELITLFSKNSVSVIVSSYSQVDGSVFGSQSVRMQLILLFPYIYRSHIGFCGSFLVYKVSRSKNTDL